jgi:hypothetical protein
MVFSKHFQKNRHFWGTSQKKHTGYLLFFKDTFVLPTYTAVSLYKILTLDE